MGIELAQAYVGVRADVAEFQSDLMQARGPVTTALGQMAQTAGGVFAGILGAVGIGSVMAFGADVVHEAESAILAEENLAAALISTGHAAGFGREELIAYAGELQDSIMHSDEEIMGIMTTLTKFDAVSGETFKRVTRLSFDMATASGSAAGAAMSLGMALEDPVRGMMRLRRAGVMFTDAEKARVKMLVAANREEEAQEVILKKVESMFAGRAEMMGKTDPGRLAILKNQISDTKESIGKALLPAVVAWNQAKLEVYKTISKLSVVIGGLVDGVRKLNEMTGESLSFLAMWAGALTGIVVILPKMVTAIRMVSTAIKTAFISNPFGWIVLGVGLAVAGIVLLVRWLSTLTPVQEAWAANSEKLIGLWTRVKTIVSNVLQGIWAGVRKVVTAVANMLGIDVSTFPATIGEAVAAGIGYVANFLDTFLGYAQAMTENWGLTWAIIKTAVYAGMSIAADVVVSGFETLAGVVTRFGEAVIVTMVQVFTVMLPRMVGIGLNIIAAVLMRVPGILKDIGQIVIAHFAGMYALLTGFVQMVVNHMKRVGTAFYEVFQVLPTLIKSVFTAILRGAVEWGKQLVNVLKAALKGNADEVVGPALSSVGKAMKDALEEGDGKAALETVGRNIEDIFKGAMGDAAKLPGMYAQAFSANGGTDALRNLRDTAGQIFDDIGGLIAKGMAKPEMQAAMGKIREAFGKVAPDAPWFKISDKSNGLMSQLKQQWSQLSAMVKPPAKGDDVLPPKEEFEKRQKENERNLFADMKAGMIGFGDFGKQIQKGILKAGDPNEITAKESVKQTTLLTDIKGQQEQILQRGFAMGLADDGGK